MRPLCLEALFVHALLLTRGGSAFSANKWKQSTTSLSRRSRRSSSSPTIQATRGDRSIPGRSRATTKVYAIDQVSTLWDSYSAALESNPLVVKSITAGVILGAADFAGQALENRQRNQSSNDGGDDSKNNDKAIDFGRAARFAIFGLVLQAPWNHFYYMLLDGQIPPTPEPFSATNVVKVLIDQFIQAPIFTVLIFAFLGTLEGKDGASIRRQLDDNYKDTIIANWKLWVPATIINIAFVPPLLRVLYLNIVFFFWSIYLSLVLNKEEEGASSS